MKKNTWEMLSVPFLGCVSVLLYILHYFIFRDDKHIYIYGLGDLAFLPMEVLIVSLILHRLLERRDRRVRVQKMNMLIGSFFSEMGVKLLRYLAEADKHPQKETFSIKTGWKKNDFKANHKKLEHYKPEFCGSELQLSALKSLLLPEKPFVNTLLQNPLLLEHRSFTDVLLAVSHLTDELDSRDSFSNLSEPDMQHLRLDALRAYSKLLIEWSEYSFHLKGSYPYLFSLNVRLNPLHREVNVEVVE